MYYHSLSYKSEEDAKNASLVVKARAYRATLSGFESSLQVKAFHANPIKAHIEWQSIDSLSDKDIFLIWSRVPQTAYYVFNGRDPHPIFGKEEI